MRLIDETVADLACLVETDFGPLAGEELTVDLVHRWLHFKARTVARRPRTVIQSAEVQVLRARHLAIGEIAAALRVGGDVSSWLSDRVRSRKRDLHADIMFNDWQISHFHLGQVFDRPDRRNRSRLLLFAYIAGDSATLLDVQPHGSWSQANLLRILLRTSPEAMPQASGLRPPKNPFNDEQRDKLRKRGLSCPIVIDGQVYFSPGIGITGARSAVRIKAYDDQLARMIRQVAEQVQSNSLSANLMRQVGSQIDVPVRLGLRFNAGIFYVYDKNRNIDLVYLPKVLV